MNLNYEGKWVENSRVLSLYEKKNYARNVFYRKVVERLFGNVKSSRKDVCQSLVLFKDIIKNGKFL